MRVNLLDAEKMNRENPKTFPIPSKEELDGVKVGDFIKVGFIVDDTNCTPGRFRVGVERMWVIVERITEGGFEGELNNDPVFINLTCGDKIENILRKNVLDITVD
jgi:hypothetical protein